MILNEERRESKNAQRARAALQVAVCTLLTLMFVAAATAAVDAPQAGAAAAVVDRTPSLRYQASDILRTSTPTLTPTRRSSSSARLPASPQTIPGQTQVDANTIALYHFDSPAGTNAIDARGIYTGTLFGNAVITNSGVYAGALQLDGNGSYVSTGQFSDPLTQGTIEAFVDFSSACPSVDETYPIITVIGTSGQTVLRVWDNVGLGFEILVNGQWQSVNSGINPCRYLEAGHSANPYPWQSVPVLWPYEAWRFHHVAATWGPRGIEIWVDGVLHGVGNNDPNAATEPFPYMCNPQMQEQSSLYPACRTPVMVPTMPAPPPGYYGGGLPSYTNFLIGYDPSITLTASSNPYFTGRVDEVRISNIQRTFSWTVDPTITPTPTWTPVSLSGEYSVDADTLALYHFNPAPAGETWEEVGKQYHGLSGQAATIPSGRFGTGMGLDGNGSFVYLNNLENLNAGTVEAWVNFLNPSPSQEIIVATPDNRNLALALRVSPQNQISLQVSSFTLNSAVTSASLMNCWHHIAGTWGPRGAEIWIDGSLSAANSSFTGGMPWPISDWRAGCDYLGFCIDGALDEVRVSNVQRTFSPATKRPVRAAPFAARTPYPGTLSARAPDSGLGNLVFLPFVQLAPTVAAPPCF